MWKFLNCLSCEIAKVAPESGKVSATICLGEEVVFASGDARVGVATSLCEGVKSTLGCVEVGTTVCLCCEVEYVGCLCCRVSPFPFDLLAGAPQVVIIRDVGAQVLLYLWTLFGEAVRCG